DAESELEAKFGWKKFLHKHHESRFTRFYEDFWMPRKFGFEKRRAHYSSLIMTEQLSRADALERIAKPLMDEHFFEREFEYIANKLGVSKEELQSIFDGPNKTFKDYKNKYWLISLGSTLMQKLGLDKRYFR
ncbi:LPS biosynthesis protein, partial [Vibrio cholerae]